MSYEDQVGEMVWEQFPFCVLSNVPIYRPDSDEERLAGFEIDHLLHANSSLTDRIFIIECKGPPVFGAHPGQLPRPNGPWNVQRPHPQNPGQTINKDAKQQVENHARALMSYLRGIPRDLQIEAWVVSRDYEGPDIECRQGRILYRLIGGSRIGTELRSLARVERIVPVRQSPLLGALRRGFPLREIGHPEVGNALSYVARCRNAIDVELFRSFEPSKGWWAVNGSAGMGKSVLLAYGLFVFASDKRVVPDPNGMDYRWKLDPFEKRAAELGLPTLANRSIFAMARKEKQVRGLEDLWTRFVAEYSKMENPLNVRFNRPVFRRWDGEIPDECNVLVIDEAHDIPPEHHARIAKWLKPDEEQLDETRRYLAIACDRHQLLRLVGADAPLIHGINFAGHTKKLWRNYRNPFAVYAGSLALMFRWFAQAGPKILPTKEQLEGEFGFKVRARGARPNEETILESWNDSHPANYWSFTVSKSPSCEGIYSQLANEGLGKSDVLWVRFSQEDEAFDYEKLSRFTYHNCFSDESADLVDKYVKGQEFPVVVIEGFPEDMEINDWRNEDETEAEKRMWKARRELYLCCSRSTCFLHFIYQAGDENSYGGGPASEVTELVAQLSQPENHDEVCRRIWSLGFRSSGITRQVPTYPESEPGVVESAADLKSLKINRPVTAKGLASALGLQVSALIEPLSALRFTLRTVKDIIPDSTAKELALKFVAILEITDVASGLGDGIPPYTSGNQPRSAAGIRSGQQIEPSTPAAPSPLEVSQFEKELIYFAKSWDFKRHNVKVGRYLALLSWLLVRKVELRIVLLGYDRGNRKYFSTSKEEIDRFANAANAQKIPASELWALTTTSTDLKRSVLNDVMRSTGISLPARQEVLQEF